MGFGTIDGTDILFIEGVRFEPKNPVDWKSQRVVLKRE